MRILAIETSCDETSAAVVEDGRKVLSNVVASQVEVHRMYNGVVPELASRCHIQYILPVIERALELGDCSPSGEGIDAVAVTRGPGLVGALLVGVETAKTLAWRWDKPLIAVHHTLGHLLSVFADMNDTKCRMFEVPPEGSEASGDWQKTDLGTQEKTGLDFEFPYLGLAVSGGHCHLVRVDGPRKVEVLGQTLDDAPGEAYDKVAKCLGLGYPGGPIVDRYATEGNPEAFDLPRPMLHRGLDFSFSGLKTAVVRAIEDFGGLEKIHADQQATRDLCASFQAAAVDVLLTKAKRALRDQKLKRLAVSGGVACNSGLRAEAQKRLRKTHLIFPPVSLCTDNAAMIGVAAAHLEPLRGEAMRSLDARAGWSLVDSVL
jgi:N6-L-threonylcarbamoyladenine synthase